MVYNIDCPVRVKMFGHVTQKRGGWHKGACAPHNIVLYCTEGTLNMSISEISEACGFSDVYYFSKTFKKIVGVSPSKTRAINQKVVN